MEQGVPETEGKKYFFRLFSASVLPIFHKTRSADNIRTLMKLLPIIKPKYSLKPFHKLLPSGTKLLQTTLSVKPL